MGGANGRGSRIFQLTRLYMCRECVSLVSVVALRILAHTAQGDMDLSSVERVHL